ncbi:hypothetical protein J5289_21360 [Rhizobium sp. B230/85]|uniref:hypothetical protein n=1 Tax=unclassified Rhizobium TaxID=2613769 RepID=UPI001AD9CEEF|nr:MULTISPECIES: hypothetical protein [unclassified Rhizobium]MBO9135159.1 hypothetical protein [Rhizobium sp. B209b/85]QXZ99050.1 hypothetical protein J5289_21360 [Rhizobium sp. B230/85]
MSELTCHPPFWMGLIEHRDNRTIFQSSTRRKPMHRFTKPILIFTACMLNFAIPVKSADMVEGYTAPRRVVVHQGPRTSLHHEVRLARATELDCSPVIYSYRTNPSYTEVKTVCSPPWKKTTGSAESGGGASSSSASSAVTAQ